MKENLKEANLGFQQALRIIAKTPKEDILNNDLERKVKKVDKNRKDKEVREPK